MAVYIALLRGINVGGNNIIPMTELISMCEEIGFKNVRTYIQSGNVVFESRLSESKAADKLKGELKDKIKNNIDVIIRTTEELETILSKNPFRDANPAQVAVHFFTNQMAENIITGFKNQGTEKIRISGREVYVHYPDGMGKSKLKFPKMDEQGTARNINTVNKLVEMGRE
jgi:uncharacterized protein (DUF1697 family)